MSLSKLRVAVIQIAPVYLDPKATIAKMISYLREAASQAQLIVFPEAILSGYPNWVNLHNSWTAATDAIYWDQYIKAAVARDGPEIALLREAAAKHNVHIVAGFIERDPSYSDVIYNSAIFIDPVDSLFRVHRKITPIRQELLYFKKGDINDLKVFDSSVGKVGIGICAEHYYSLYKYRLAELGEEIHCSLWVNVAPLRHVVDCAARAIAVENNTFVLLASQVTTGTSASGCELSFIGGSGIIGPNGNYLAGPVYDQETIIYAEIEAASIRHWSTVFRCVGRDNRDDLFTLQIKGKS